MSLSIIIPLIITVVSATALCRRTDVYAALTAGISDGLKVVLRVFPAVVAILTAVYMLRASGALEAFTAVLAPLFEFFGIPAETASLILIRPLSGSGALAVGSDLIKQYGADSLIGRTAAVMLGSTETTFYTIAVYFGAAKVRNSRYAIPAALTADFTGFFVASLTVKLLFF